MLTCVASQGKRAKTELTLGATSLRRYFGDRQIFSAYEVKRGKPFPDLFLAAANAFDVPPERCVVVEDSISGMRAGLAPGMRVIAYVEPDGTLPDLTGVTVVRDMADVPALLGVELDELRA